MLWLALPWVICGSPVLPQQPPVPVPASQQEWIKDPREIREDPFERMRAELEWFGAPPSIEFLDAKKAVARDVLRAEKARMEFRQKYPFLAPAPPAWTSLGPTGGRVAQLSPTSPDIDAGRLAIQGIVPHPTNPQILYIATAGGGVWKATNADLNNAGDWNWTPLTDNLPIASANGSIACGALAMSPADPQTLFLGMGDFADPVSGAARGLFRTTDGGSTWTELSSLGQTTFVIQILPLDANIILVGGNDGLWRSTDAGQSFTKASFGGATYQVWSLKSLGGGRVVMSLQTQNSGGPPYITLANPGTIWWSMDSGASWTKSTLDASAQAASPARITLANSPAAANTLWGIANKASDFNNLSDGLFKSLDGGQNWTFVARTDGLHNGGQAWYNQLLAVHPQNANQVFLSGALVGWRSLDGGTTWRGIFQYFAGGTPYAHADPHTTAWSITNPPALFMGNDGGLSILRDPLRSNLSFPSTPYGDTASDVTYLDNRRNKGLVTNLVFGVGSTTASSPSDSRWKVSLALQDIGMRVRNAAGSTQFDEDNRSGPTRGETFLGDGVSTLWHPLNGNMLIGCYNGGGICRSTDGGATFIYSASGILHPMDFPFWTRAIAGPADPTGNTVYTFESALVYRSTDFAATWSPLGTTGLPASFQIRALGVSPHNQNVMALAHYSAQVPGTSTYANGFYTTNGGSTWQPFGALPAAAASGPWSDRTTPGSIAFSPNSEGTVYLTAVTQDASVSHIWKSTDYGATWTSIDRRGDGTSNGLPLGLPIHVVRTDPTDGNLVFAGTELGVFASGDGGQNWTRYGLGLPMVAVRDIWLAPDKSLIRVGTWGRGAWEAPYQAPAPPTLSISDFLPKNAAPGVQVRILGTLFTGATAVAFNGKPATFQVVSDTEIHATVPAGGGSGPIQVTAPAGSATSGTFTVLGPDLNGDGTADVLDLGFLARAFGTHPGDPLYSILFDLNGDGLVDDLDTSLFLNLAGF